MFEYVIVAAPVPPVTDTVPAVSAVPVVAECGTRVEYVLSEYKPLEADSLELLVEPIVKTRSAFPPMTIFAAPALSFAISTDATEPSEEVL